MSYFEGLIEELQSFAEKANPENDQTELNQYVLDTLRKKAADLNNLYAPVVDFLSSATVDDVTCSPIVCAKLRDLELEINITISARKENYSGDIIQRITQNSILTRHLLLVGDAFYEYDDFPRRFPDGQTLDEYSLGAYINREAQAYGNQYCHDMNLEMSNTRVNRTNQNVTSLFSGDIDNLFLPIIEYQIKGKNVGKLSLALRQNDYAVLGTLFYPNSAFFEEMRESTKAEKLWGKINAIPWWPFWIGCFAGMASLFASVACLIFGPRNLFFPLLLIGGLGVGLTFLKGYAYDNARD